MRSTFLVSLFIIIVFKTVAQNVTRPNLNILSPQTYEFVKYGNVPVSHFTGETNLQVPIYTYKDKDFELPIFLGYNSSGFRPNKRESIVGLNWYLGGAGGVITRQIREVADERQGVVYAFQAPIANGILYGIRNNSAIKTIDRTSIFNISFPTQLMEDGNDNYLSVDGCELQPDEFTFNTPDGHSGKFFIQNNGELKVSGNKPYQIDISGVPLQYQGNKLALNFPSSIKITTDDGYVYHFGGTEQYLEISYSLESAGRAESADIIGWHLNKIEAPNGRVVIFEYELYQPLNNQILPVDSKHFLFSSYEYIYFLESLNPMTPSPTPVRRLEATKTVYLKKIIVDNQTTISFTNNQRQRKFYVSNPENFNQAGLQLDCIEILVAGNPTPIHKYIFNYEYLGGVHARQFLTSYSEVGIPAYRFEYYNTANLPDPLTRSVDYWGFWNGRNTDRLIPDWEIDESTQNITYTSADKDPDGAKANTTLLQKIYYPTGGYTEFTYEPHQYRERLERRDFTSFWPALYTIVEQPIAGGARIKTIVDHDGIKETNRRSFEYTQTEMTLTNGPSSGILMSWPRYVFAYNEILNLTSNSFHVNHYPGEAHIQYSEVTEFNVPANGCTSYKFTSYKDHPDIKDFKGKVLGTWQWLFGYYYGLKLNDHSFERGHPLEITTYASRVDASYYPVSKKLVTYTEKEDNPSAYIAGLHQIGTAIQSFKIPYHPFLPKTETQISYYEEGIRSNSLTTNTTYKPNGYLATQSVLNSEGKLKTLQYRYLDEFILAEDEPALFTGTMPTAKYLSLAPELKALVDMKWNNILNRPIEIINSVNGNVTNGNLIYYKDIASVNFSKKVYANQSWKTETNPVGFVPTKIEKGATWTLSKHTSYETEPSITFDKFDNIGNVIEMTDQNKTKISYIWDYIFPIAEFVGASVNTVFYSGFEQSDSDQTTNCRTGNNCRAAAYSKTLENLVSGNYVLTYWIKTTVSSSWELVNQSVVVSGSSYTINIPAAYSIDDVRFFPSNKPVMVNTFTFRPQVGMTSKTDSNNKTEFYFFDNLGRLELIKDSDGNIMKSFDYQFKGN